MDRTNRPYRQNSEFHWQDKNTFKEPERRALKEVRDGCE